MAIQFIGVRAHDYGRQTPEKLLGDIAADGWQAVQLALKKAVAGIETMADADDAAIARIHSALRRNRLHPAVIGSYIEPALVIDDQKREAGIRDFLRNIAVAKELGADCVGTETTRSSTQPTVTRQEALRTLYHSLETLLTRAEELGVDIAIEPVWVHTVNTPELAAEVLRTMASPRLKIIFDPVNLLSAEALPQQDDLWERSFEAFGPVITAVHLKGAVLAEPGRIAASGFTESVVDYPFLMERLQKLPQRFSILREEARPERGPEDFAFMKRLCDAAKA